MPKLSIIFPTYNEAENIEILIPKVEDFLKKNKLSAEIIIVDDSSPDGTANIAKKFNKKYKNIKVIIKEKKEGIGAALRLGYNRAKGDIIISSDSDLSFEVNDIMKLVNKLEEGYDLVVGSRHIDKHDYVKESASTYVKGFISYFGNIIVRIISGINIHDFSANFRAIKRSVWDSINTKENTNSILLEMILKTKYYCYKIAEIPVIFKERVYGNSKLNLIKEAPKFFLKLIYYTKMHKKQ